MGVYEIRRCGAGNLRVPWLRVGGSSTGYWFRACWCTEPKDGRREEKKIIAHSALGTSRRRAANELRRQRENIRRRRVATLFGGGGRLHRRLHTYLLKILCVRFACLFDNNVVTAWCTCTRVRFMFITYYIIRIYKPEFTLNYFSSRLAHSNIFFKLVQISSEWINWLDFIALPRRMHARTCLLLYLNLLYIFYFVIYIVRADQLVKHCTDFDDYRFYYIITIIVLSFYNAIY